MTIANNDPGQVRVAAATETANRYFRRGLTVVAVAAIGLAAWSVLAPLDSAVVAQGEMTVASSRKAVQHLQGGIVADILVEEGDFVEAGQQLVSLNDGELQSELVQVEGRLAAIAARRGRILASLNDGEFSQHPIFRQVNWVSQSHHDSFEASRLLFERRRAGLNERLAAFDNIANQMEQRLDGIERERAARERELDILNRELDIVSELQREGLRPEVEVLAKEREIAQVEVSLGTLYSREAELYQQVFEHRARRVELTEGHYTEAAAELENLQVELVELVDRYTVASERQERMSIRASDAGRVVDVQQERVGGVLGAGETIMYIIPQDGELIVEARIDPSDAHDLVPGQEADIRFPGLGFRRTPVLSGELLLVSADRLEDERTGQPYYAAEIRLTDDTRSYLDGVTLMPGMPTEVVVRKQPRTVLSYLISPLTDGFVRAFRES